MNLVESTVLNGCSEMNIPAGANALHCFSEYANMLSEQNKVMNLTAIEGEENIARLHFLDCAALLQFAGFENRSVIDIGTGAGFPGLPLKILEPSIKLTLFDSLEKRIKFLEDTCEKLNITDCMFIHGRAEESAHDEKLREQFDICVSRAVARLSLLCEICLPFVKQGGVMIAMKGPEPEAEAEEAANAIRLLGGSIKEVRRYTVPGTDIVHTAVIIQKNGITSGKYPRKWSQIKKSSL